MRHPTMRGPLTDTERSIITLTLEVAAEQYERDSKIDEMPETLRDQFIEQARTVRAWAILIEEATEVIIK